MRREKGISNIAQGISNVEVKNTDPCLKRTGMRAGGEKNNPAKKAGLNI